MIVVKIELWPLGFKEGMREIGRMYIANDGGTAQIGNYRVGVCRKGTTEVPQPVYSKGPKPTRQGEVKGFPRKSYSVWRLIARAILECFPEEKGKADAA